MKIRKLILWSLLVFSPLIASPLQAGDSDPILTFKENLERSYPILTSPTISHDLKRQEIDRVFRQMESACANNCLGVLNFLDKANAQLSSPSLQKILTLIPDEKRESLFLEQERLDKISSLIESFLAKTDRKKVSQQLAAGVQFLRYVVAVEEKNLLDLADPAKKTQAARALDEEIASFAKQIRALIDLGLVVTHGNSLAHPDYLQRVFQDIHDLGFFFKKIGQSLSNLGFLPPAMQESLQMLQDRNPPMSPEQVRAVIKRNLGKEPEELFDDFDLNKSISNGVVAPTFEARVKQPDGKGPWVTVKVRHPDAKASLEASKRFNGIALQGAKIINPEGSWLMDIASAMVLGLEDDMKKELDFRHEAEKIEKFGKYFEKNPNFKIPKVYHHLSGEEVVTMERMPGINIERYLDQLALATQGKGRVQITAEEATEKRVHLLSKLLDMVTFQMTELDEMHADMHPGNILVMDDGTLAMEKNLFALIDFGQTYNTQGIISSPGKAYYAAVSGDAADFVKQIEKMGKFPAENLPKYQAWVEKTMADMGIQRSGLFSIVTGGAPDSTKILEFMAKAIPEALNHQGFRPHGTYLHAVRALLPVYSTMARIAREIPPERLKEMTGLKMMILAPKDAMKVAGLKFLLKMDPSKGLAEKCSLFFATPKPVSQ